MKKFKAVLLFLGFLFLTFPLSYCFAWSNASYAYNPNDYDYNTDYGTHDWVADAALNALINNDPGNWDWLNDVNRKKIYLLGTEAPDNSGIDITLNGDSVTGFGDTPLHHVYVSIIATNLMDNASAVRAKACGDIAAASINSNKLDKAAFYLGAMTHYIADQGMYAHTVPNNQYPDYLNFDEHHSTVESRVLTRTNDYENKEEFFRFSVLKPVSKAPYDAAVQLAWETYQDPTPSDSITRNAVWLHNNFFSSWASNYQARSSDSAIHQKYYDRIEECLNNAIWYVASAMLYVGGIESSTFPSYPIPVLIFILNPRFTMNNY